MITTMTRTIISVREILSISYHNMAKMLNKIKLQNVTQ